MSHDFLVVFCYNGVKIWVIRMIFYNREEYPKVTVLDNGEIAIEEKEKRYNQSYIDDYEEAKYLECLSDSKNVMKLFTEYKKDNNSYWLSFKESLDHYVVKRIISDKDFLNTKEFKNYLLLLQSLIEEKDLELNTNIVFRNEEIRNIVFERLGNKDELSQKYETRKRIIENLFLKMSQNIILDSESILLVSEYLYRSRDFSNEKGTIFLKYVLNNRDKLSVRPIAPLTGAFASILPSYFTLDDRVKECRIFLALYSDEDYRERIYSASAYNENICAMNKN